MVFYASFGTSGIFQANPGEGTSKPPLHLALLSHRLFSEGLSRNPQSWEKHNEALHHVCCCRGVVSGDFVDNSLFGLIFELDESDDPFAPEFDLQTLKKSNPGLNLSVKPEYLQAQLHEAINKPAAKSRFLRYHGNICVMSQGSLIGSEEYDQASGELSDWSEAEAIGAGIDLGGRDDLCSYALAARFKHSEDKDGRPVYRYEVRSRSFIGDDVRRAGVPARSRGRGNSPHGIPCPKRDGVVEGSACA